MERESRRLSHRRRLAATLAVLAVGVAGCGGSDDASDEASATAGSAGSDKTFADTPAGDVRKLYAAYVDGYYAKDPKRICALLTPAAKKELQQAQTFGSAGSAKDRTCPGWFKSIWAAGPTSPNRPYVVSLKINGPKAVALVKTKNSNKYAVPFVEKDGEWQIESLLPNN